MLGRVWVCLAEVWKEVLKKRIIFSRDISSAFFTYTFTTFFSFPLLWKRCSYLGVEYGRWSRSFSWVVKWWRNEFFVCMGICLLLITACKNGLICFAFVVNWTRLTMVMGTGFLRVLISCSIFLFYFHRSLLPYCIKLIKLNHCQLMLCCAEWNSQLSGCPRHGFLSAKSLRCHEAPRRVTCRRRSPI